jgi:hypothetical protein
MPPQAASVPSTPRHPTIVRSLAWQGSDTSSPGVSQSWVGVVRPDRSLRHSLQSQSRNQRVTKGRSLATEHKWLAGFEMKNALAQWSGLARLVASEGFEPPKSKTADLQSDPFGHLGNSPGARSTRVVTNRSRPSRIQGREGIRDHRLAADKMRAVNAHTRRTRARDS